MKQDHEKITLEIIKAVEKGVRRWVKPWSVGRPGPVSRPLRADGIPYQGVNRLLLWGQAVIRGFNNPIWCNDRRAKAGGHVRLGELGSMVVSPDKTEGADIVFNVEQVDHLPAHFYAGRHAPMARPIDVAEAFIKATGAAIFYGGGRAFYEPNHDFVCVPPPKSFADTALFYACVFHELIHWVGHPSRLDRDYVEQEPGIAGHRKEEVAAALGAAFLCADLGIAGQARQDRAEYIGQWMKGVEEKRRAILTVSAAAEEAVDYLHSLQPKVPGPQP